MLGLTSEDTCVLGLTREVLLGTCVLGLTSEVSLGTCVLGLTSEVSMCAWSHK